MLAPHEAFLRGLIDGADLTLEEVRARLFAERDLSVGLGRMIWTFVDARGLTYEKRRPTRPSTDL